MQHDFVKVEAISKELVDKMQEKHPGDGYTIWINLWMDDTFQVRCVSAKPVGDTILILREFKWYDGEITYLEETKDDSVLPKSN